MHPGFYLELRQTLKAGPGRRLNPTCERFPGVSAAGSLELGRQ